jgi:hypothetical protein
LKSFARVKKIDSQEYLYEITPYYDKKKKQIRRKSKYLGKNVNGGPVKVRSQDKIPKKVLSHGELVPLKKIAEDHELEKILTSVLPEKEVWPILTLAMNYATRLRALTHIQSWYEGTAISEDHPDLPLPSQSLSRMLSAYNAITSLYKYVHMIYARLKRIDLLMYPYEFPPKLFRCKP